MGSNLQNDYKNALITGASSGIGAAIARELGEYGLHVILVARRKDRLESVAQDIRQQGGKATVIAADLAEVGAVDAICQQVLSRFERLDILVNNAGLGWYGYFRDMPWGVAQNMLQVNVQAALKLSRLFLPGMLQRKAGHLINIGSISASIPSQGIALYSASKAFLDAFTTSLHRELKGSGVHVSIVRAGAVHSEFYDLVKEQEAGFAIPVERFAISAVSVARRVRKLIAHPRRVLYVPGWLRIVPWVELVFGGLMDRLGPLLLRFQSGRV